MSLKIKKQIAGLPEYVAGRTLEEIKQEYGLDQVYKLASNENLFGLPPGLAEKMASYMDSMIYYPDAGCVMIRKRLSEFYGIPDDQIIIGSGSDQIIEMICDTFTGPGDNIVIADPTFPIYEKSALNVQPHQLLLHYIALDQYYLLLPGILLNSIQPPSI